MPKFHVRFPDGEAWNIEVKGKKGEEALLEAYARAAKARAVDGKDTPPFEECAVNKMTPQFRARLKGVTYLTKQQLLDVCNSIALKYQQDGMSLTVRGMYYQLVSRGYIPSGQAEYNRVKNTLSAARIKGDFPLELLSDASRTLHYGDVMRFDLNQERALESAGDWIPKLDQFFVQVSRWFRQPIIPFVLFEKEALSNVFGPPCQKLGVSWLATKGYPSVSILHQLHLMMASVMNSSIQDQNDLFSLGFSEAQEHDPTTPKGLARLLVNHEDAIDQLENYVDWAEEDEDDIPVDSREEGTHGGIKRYGYGKLTGLEWHEGSNQEIKILYFGDHDPDGMEIPLDLERRLKIIQVREGVIVPFTVERMALNKNQIQQYSPPPFWAKPTSTRHAKYVRDHGWAGNDAWELDALDPQVLRSLARRAIDACFDGSIHQAILNESEVVRKEFRARMYGELLPRLVKEKR
jgi:hypothetical protein